MPASARTRALLRCAVLTLALGLVAVPVAQARSPRVVIAFLPSGGENNPKPILDRLDARPALAIGLVSATQGQFSPEQMVLDLSAGSRTSRAVYKPSTAPHLELVRGGDGSGFIFGWSKVLERAATAPAEIKPGLLADRIPGGAGYVGVAGRNGPEAVVAADREGDVAAVSLGTAATLPRRTVKLLAHHLLVVVGLPTSDKGDAALDGLLRDHDPADLLIVVQAPPHVHVPILLPMGVAGLGAGGSLTSTSTRLDGIVAGIDIPVTVLEHLGITVPDGVRGQPIRAEGVRDAARLKEVEARLRVVSGRRTPMLGALAFSWLALVLTLGLVADRRGVRAGMRIGALAIFWVLPLLLLTGWIAPSRIAEIAIVVIGAFGLGAATDRLVRWPRAPLVPAAVALVAYCTDLAFGSPLIIRSLLGVNPRSGSRFYGLGNELESTLSALLLISIGALLWRQPQSRRSAAIVACIGAVFAVFVGASQLGADVGGVITVGAGIAAATLVMLPGTPSKRMIALAAMVPVLGLMALALLDLVTGGDGHFTRTVLHADSFGALLDVGKRRYTLAFNVLSTGAMPLVTVVALLGAAYAIRHRVRVYAPLGDSPSWRAAFIGGLAASIAGALFNDSGPLLFVFGVFVLACATAYIRGDPRLGHDS